MPSPSASPPRDSATGCAQTLDRRTFLKVAAAAPATLSAASGLVRAAVDPLPAAVIGHTGRGDYGHGMDLIFNDLPGVTVVAVADPDPAGRAKAAGRCKAARQYADYREML